MPPAVFQYLMWHGLASAGFGAPECLADLSVFYGCHPTELSYSLSVATFFVLTFSSYIFFCCCLRAEARSPQSVDFLLSMVCALWPGSLGPV